MRENQIMKHPSPSSTYMAAIAALAALAAMTIPVADASARTMTQLDRFLVRYDICVQREMLAPVMYHNRIRHCHRINRERDLMTRLNASNPGAMRRLARTRPLDW